MVSINLIHQNHKNNENYTAEKILNSWWKKDCDLTVFRVSQWPAIVLTYLMFTELNSAAHQTTAKYPKFLTMVGRSALKSVV